MNRNILIATYSYLYLYRARMKKKNKTMKRVRRWATLPSNQKKFTHGYFNSTFAQIKETDAELFLQHTRMSSNLYDMLEHMIKKAIVKPKQRITAEERLSITLLYLAQGINIQVIAKKYRIGKSTVRLIILETCEAIWSTLAPLYLKEPNQSKYVDIAKEFKEICDFPNCVGAIGAKHIPVRCANITGNNAKEMGIILMATSDAKYRFTTINVSCLSTDSQSYFRDSVFCRALLENKLPLPPDTPLPDSKETLPHIFVAKSSFPLRTRILKPIVQIDDDEPLELKHEIYNHKLCQARGSIENAFGVLSIRWRILLTTLEFMPNNCEILVRACLVLHNFIMHHERETYCPSYYVDCYAPNQKTVPGKWRSKVKKLGGPLKSVSSHASNVNATNVRKKFVDYFLLKTEMKFED